jgi:heme/copper-type cytochrome/quinol oxidase subunit 3
MTGVIYLSVIFIRALLGQFEGGKHNHIEIAGLFWHFVDLVWIIVFTFVYLVPATPS